MDDSVSLSAAWTTINKRPAPHVTVEAIKQAVRERGEAALEEPSTKERLQRCDGAALAALDRWLLKHGFSNDRTRNS
jgi:hypothetical protein